MNESTEEEGAKMTKSDDDAPEDVWPKKGSSGSSNGYGYSVEARYAYFQPLVLGNQAFDLRWQRVSYESSDDPTRPGVPGSRFNIAGEHGMFSYAQAEALRWWFIAQVDATAVGGSLCLETRIVTHKISSSYSVEAISAEEAQKHPRK